jgi:hypothetical protein
MGFILFSTEIFAACDYPSDLDSRGKSFLNYSQVLPCKTEKSSVCNEYHRLVS